jgi:hypothetical protein
MVIDYLHVMRAVRFPTEADPPLIVNPDAALPLADTFQGLKAISGWHTHFIQHHSGIQHFQFPLHDSQQVSGQTP